MSIPSISYQRLKARCKQLGVKITYWSDREFLLFELPNGNSRRFKASFSEQIIGKNLVNSIRDFFSHNGYNLNLSELD